MERTKEIFDESASDLVSLLCDVAKYPKSKRREELGPHFMSSFYFSSLDITEETLSCDLFFVIN